MTRRVILSAALTLLAIAACLPVAGFLFVGWNTCVDAVLARPAMVPVTARLVDMHSTPRPMRGSTVSKSAEYSYRFGDRVYTGTAITFCARISRGSMMDPMRELEDQLMPLIGKDVIAWVDPNRPEHAVLVRYVPRAAMLVIGVGLFLVPLLMFRAFSYCALRLRRRFGAMSLLPPESTS